MRAGWRTWSSGHRLLTPGQDAAWGQAVLGVSQEIASTNVMGLPAGPCEAEVGCGGCLPIPQLGTLPSSQSPSDWGLWSGNSAGSIRRVPSGCHGP